jgi:hypothetical protein
MYELLLGGESFSVAMIPLITNCHLFQQDRTLIGKPNYQVKSHVSADSLRVFINGLSGSEAAITSDNVGDLVQLCAEFQCSPFSEKIDTWRSEHSAVDCEVRQELRALCAAVAEQRVQHDNRIAALERKFAAVPSDGHNPQATADIPGVVAQLATDLQEATAENGRLREAAASLRAEIGQLRGLVGAVDVLRQRIDSLELENRRRSEADRLLRHDLAKVADRETKAKEDLAAAQRDVSKLKQDFRFLKVRIDEISPPTSENSAARSTPPRRLPTLTASPTRAKQFPPSLKKGTKFEIPDGIVAYLARQCGGNVHDRGVVEVTSGSFDKTTRTPSGWRPAKCVTDMETDSTFYSAYRRKEEDIRHTRNNWICYDFGERWITPTHYAIRSYVGDPGSNHLKSWLVETSVDGDTWQEVDHRQDNDELNRTYAARTFTIARAASCRLIRLVNIGRNHFGYDCLMVTAWEIFGSLTG